MQLTAILRSHSWRNEMTHKLLRVMKLTAVLLFAACMQVAARTEGQTVTLKVKNAPMKEVFREIQKQTGLNVMVDEAILEKAGRVTLDVRDMPVPQVLNICLKNEPLTYTIVDGRIVVKSAPTVVFQPTVTTPPLPPPITVRGRVVNENGEPVVASVLVKGTQNGTTTDANGFFTLNNVDENATLVITGVSIETYEVKVSGKTDLAISVKTKVTEQEEVTINAGYYKTTEKNRTGSISKVAAKDITKLPVTSPLLALQGQVPGVYIAPNGGAPGSAPRIQIRGINSLRFNGNYPLYVIDGVPVDSRPLESISSSLIATGFDPLNSFNLENIESIEILKDADATAIYGSRGANGIILITTKQGGRSERTTLDASVYTGTGKIVNRMNVLNAQQYLQMRHEAFANDGAAPGQFDYDINGTWDTTNVTDWQKVLLGGTSNIKDAQANVSWGNGTTSFRFGGSFHKETMVFDENFGYQRATGNFSLNHLSSNNKFRALISFNYGTDKNKLFDDLNYVNYAINLPPVAPQLFTAGGELNWQPNISGASSWANPLSLLKKTDETKISNLLINSDFSYELFKGFLFKANLGYTDLNGTQLTKIPLSSKPPEQIRNGETGQATFGTNKRKTWIIEPQFKYVKKISDHNFDLVLGSTIQESFTQVFFAQGRGYTSDVFLESLKSAPLTTITNDQYAKYRYVAFYSRIGYNYDNKYLLNLTGRRDGSSRFGPNYQFGNFGAVGAAWIFSNEKFIQKKLKFLNFGKIRASYGITGSDQIGDYGFYDTYTVPFFLYQGGQGLTPTSLYNPNYAWEETKKLEIATQLGFIDNRIEFEVSWYQNRSSNQLISYQQPLTTGFSNIPNYNFPATVQNSGWDFFAKTENIRSSTISWTSSFNISINRNKLVAFPDIDISTYKNTYQIGRSLSIRRLYVWTGINPQTGAHTFLDSDNNGMVNDADKEFVDVSVPKYYGGLKNSIRYKNLELSFLLQFTKNNGIKFLPALPGTRNNQSAQIINRWQKPGDITDIAKYSQLNYTGYFNATSSTYYIEDASFIRLKTLSLSYKIPNKLVSKAKIREGQVFINAHNLLTITNYEEGFDPETGTALPPLRIISLGIQLKF